MSDLAQRVGAALGVDARDPDAVVRELKIRGLCTYDKRTPEEVPGYDYMRQMSVIGVRCPDGSSHYISYPLSTRASVAIQAAAKALGIEEG